MKIVHTSDWHAGRVWKRQDRLDELSAALGSMVDYVDEHDVDLVLMSGDLFDSRAPAGKAERLVARIFRDLSATGAQTVVIAGNHDSPTRLAAWKLLAELAHVHIVPRPAGRTAGGIVEVQSRDGSETALIAAIPFAAASRLVSSRVMGDDESASYQRYSDAFAGIVRHLSEAFRDDTINIIMAHTHLESAVLARSERTVHTGEQWAAQPQSLPNKATYVALGHIHRPQKVIAPAPAYYAGSPIQLDFGEIGETKTFNAIEASPGLPPDIRKIEYREARPLRHFEGTLEELEAKAPDLQECWLRVVVHLEERDPDLSRKVRDLVPDAVVIKVELPERETEEQDWESRANLSMAELFDRYWSQEMGGDVPEGTKRGFLELLEEVQR